MNAVRKEAGIKDKEVKSLHYMASVVEKADTIILKDTVFVKDVTETDTIVGDAWYNMRVRLKYPNFIAIAPKFFSQKYVTVYTRKETVNPAKKCWFLRLFQKKHKVVEVNVVEKNPYIKDSISRYVEVIK